MIFQTENKNASDFLHNNKNNTNNDYYVNIITSFTNTEDFWWNFFFPTQMNFNILPGQGKSYSDNIPLYHAKLNILQNIMLSSFIQCYFTFTETVWTVRGGKPRKSTSIFIQLLSSDIVFRQHSPLSCQVKHIVEQISVIEITESK